MIKLAHVTRSASDENLTNATAAWRRLVQRQDLGFLQIAERLPLWENCEQRASSMGHAQRLVVFGIGGSSLGGRAIQQALQTRLKRPIDFFDNVDGRLWHTKFSTFTDGSSTHWAFISKSGTTLETMAMIDALYEQNTVDKRAIAKNATVISELKNSPITDWARREGIPILEISTDIGGRYSVLTPVGMFPAAFAGLNIEDFRCGARWAMKQESLVVPLVAQALQGWQQQEWLTMLWTYCSGLTEWGLWARQLWAESLGKRENLHGQSAPRVSWLEPCLGSTDQHSVLQHVAEGQERKSVWFLRVTDSEASGPRLVSGPFVQISGLHGKRFGELLGVFAESTRDALSNKGVQSLTLTLERLNEESLGALFQTLMLVVATLGEALEINAFDQPGVELGKRLAQQRLQNDLSR